MKAIDGDLFNEEYFASGAFQYGHTDKKIDLNNILTFFDIPNHCAVLYDDAQSNGKSALAVGVNWVRASDKCNGRTEFIFF